MDLSPFGIHFQHRQARHICSIQNQTMFQAPSGAEYGAPSGLGMMPIGKSVFLR
jgi:hypothetical protein